MSAIDLLKQAMDAIGMERDDLKFSLLEQEVQYPGGSYWNRHVGVSGRGRRERYDATAIERGQALITAYEAVRLFGSKSNASH